MMDCCGGREAGPETGVVANRHFDGAATGKHADDLAVFDVVAPAVFGGEAKALTATDPVIQSGEMVAEYHKLYSSAALMLVNETHAKVAKEKM